MSGRLNHGDPGGWASVVSDVRGRIERGELAPGGRVPPRHVLAAQAGVSRYAVSRALQHLAVSGAIAPHEGNRNGYVVTRAALGLLPAPDIPRLLAAGLRRLRMERGLTQGQAAALLGADTSAVCRIEQGTRSPMPARRIAAAFGVEVAEVTAPCPRCGYDPPAGYMCLRCGTSGADGIAVPEKLAAAR